MSRHDLCFGCMEEVFSESLCPYCAYDQSSGPASPHHLAPGTILQGKYLIGKVLGQGGFGITYLAWDTILDIKIAVKEFFPLGLVARSFGGATVDIYGSHYKEQFIYGKTRFLSEAKTLARFSEHPNIVTVRDFFEANDTAYMVMNYVEGKTLEEYLKQSGGNLSFSKMLEIMMPVMDALREVHETGYLHRDVSPDNIFIRKDGRVILIDFGSARQELQSKSQSLSVILKTGYSPEEQYRSKGEQGPWTDIYTVAASIYRGITGQLPPEAMDRLDSDELKAPSQLDIEISEEQEEALLKGIAVKSKERFQSVSDFQHALINSSAVKPNIKEAESFGEIKATILDENRPKVDHSQSGEPKDKGFSSRLFEKTVAPKIAKNTLINKKKKAVVLLSAALFFLTTGFTAAHFYYPIYDLSFEPGEMTLVIGEETDTFILKGKPFFASLKNLTWDKDLDNRQYASIIEYGVVEPHEVGTRTIMVSTKDGSVSSSLVINVVHPTISWDGGTYTGEFEDGVPQGKGEWVSPGGERYIGDWREGEYHGRGKWVDPSGETYDGQWLQGEFTGRGTWTHPSGESYEGNWFRGVFSGKGVWWGPDGDKFEGNFSEGKWHGFGTYTKVDGTVKKGYWEDEVISENYVASINAVVSGLKFFESGYDYLPANQRIYSNRFASRNSRFINWELDILLPSDYISEWVNYTWIYYNPNGIEFEYSGTERGSYFGNISHGYGWNETGNWQRGSYRFVFIINGETVATGSFEIY